MKNTCLQTTVILSFLFVSLSLWAQETSGKTLISGYLYDAAGNGPVEYANVILGKSGSSAIYMFTISDSEGYFEFQYSGADDSLRLQVSSMGYKQLEKVVSNESGTYRLYLEKEICNIDEVVFTHHAIDKRKDTMSFNVSRFQTPEDKVVADVIRKIPGLDVSKSGNITYNGRRIDKFYIEDLNLLGEDYGLAVNNVKADDIEKIEVIQNHNHIQALDNRPLQDGGVAVNLRLKESSKGVWGASLQAGGGYKPAMWTAEALAMMFSRKFQSLNVYKTNNTGDDVSNEFADAFLTDGRKPALTVKLPSEPPFEENRYLRNHIHSVSTNQIAKINDSTLVRGNIHYVHDETFRKGQARTVYHLETGPFSISEEVDARRVDDRMSAVFEIEQNTRTIYINDCLSFVGMWNRDAGHALSDGQNIWQSYRSPNLNISNTFSLYKNRWSFDSDISYSDKPEYLNVSPVVWPDLFPDAGENSKIVQSLLNRCFRTYNTGGYEYRMKNLTLGMRAGVQACLEWMESGLYARDDEGGMALGSSLDNEESRNDIYWQDIGLSLSPEINYMKSGVFLFNARLKTIYHHLEHMDRITGVGNKRDYVAFHPNLFMQTYFTSDFRWELSARYDEQYGDLYDSFNGYIMTDYRTLSKNTGDFNLSRKQSYQSRFTYEDSFNALFLNFGGGYARIWNSHQKSVRFSEDILTSTESVNAPNVSQSFNAFAGFSKRIFPIQTTLRLDLTYQRSLGNLIYQESEYRIVNDMVFGRFSFDTRFCSWVGMDYFIHAQMMLNDSDLTKRQDPIYSLQQKLSLNFQIVKNLFLVIDGEHYYNDAIPNQKSTFYLDAYCRYKYRRLEFALELRNLLNTDIYRSVQYDDMMTYTYEYMLNPISIIMKIKYDF